MNLKTYGLFLLMLAELITPPPLSHAFEFPEEALRLIAESNSDPCSICAGQSLKKAIAILDKGLRPGTIIEGSKGCGMVKSGSEQEFTLTCHPSGTLIGSLREDEMPPSVVFSFHTAGKKLVGISDNDLTGREISDIFSSLKPGTAFKARIRLIPYMYGDGATFNYYKSTNTIQIHSMILEIRQPAP